MPRQGMIGAGCRHPSYVGVVSERSAKHWKFVRIKHQGVNLTKHRENRCANTLPGGVLKRWRRKYARSGSSNEAGIMA